jgi:hypothetical protein
VQFLDGTTGSVACILFVFAWQNAYVGLLATNKSLLTARTMLARIGNEPGAAAKCVSCFAR